LTPFGHQAERPGVFRIAYLARRVPENLAKRLARDRIERNKVVIHF
jgi:hypothetical protein